MSRGDVAGVAAVGVTVAAAAVHIGSVLTRGLAAQRVPWGNLYEFVLTATLAGALTWLVVMLRRGPTVRPVDVFVTLALALLLGGAGRVHVRVAPLAPALD